MYLINSCTEYALLALAFMSGKDGIISAKDLSTELGIPRQYLRRILQDLKKHRFIVAHRGQKGGFVLARDPATITVFEVLDVFQDGFNVSRCSTIGSTCGRATGCFLRPHLKELELEFQKKLQALTLDSLVSERSTPC